MSTFTPPTIEALQDKFPSYEIESFIAQGGMGAVYLARQISLDRPVAIKILPSEFGDDKNYRISFETEAKAMAKLNHNNLVGIYDFGDMDGMLYIIMEYIPGRSLYDTANGQMVDQLEAARLIADMSDGLSHAHKAGMLHRDIKPANVLIDDEVRPKIVDFGLARPMGDSETEGVVFGTPGYTAPEVLNDPYSVDQRSDIYSMGVMLYELLTAELPGDPFIPASVSSLSDRRFDAIVSKAIHYNPDKRYKNASALSNDLHDLIKNFEDKPLAVGLKTGGTTAVKGRALSTLAGSRSPSVGSVGMSRVTAKQSSSSSVVLVLFILVGIAVGGVFLYKNHTKNKEMKEAQALAEAQEQEAEVKRVAERKRREAQALREKREAREREDRIREEQRLAQISNREEKSAAEEERKAKELKRLERENEMLAKKIKEANKVKTTQAPKFDTEKFITEAREGYVEKLADHRDEIIEEKTPHIKKLERGLKRAVRRWNKGRPAEAAMATIESYIENALETGLVGSVPDKLDNDLKKGAYRALGKYERDAEKIIKKYHEGIKTLRKSYINELEKKIAELETGGDKDGVDALTEEVENVKSNEAFVQIFDEEEDAE